jgi:hypothetical protein
MAATRIGILSDTHLARPSALFTAQVARCFADVAIIFHAGDLTNADILGAFPDKEVYAVHGNMCEPATRQQLPTVREITINDFKIILTHGYGYGYHDLEERLFHEFAEADCIVYGHTHVAACHRLGHILFINPGSFTLAGRAGAPGTYAILEIDQALRGRIKELPRVA